MTKMARKLYTLTIIKEKDNLLLGLKKRGFGKNKIHGFGGKVEENETITGAAIREVQEECGVDVTGHLRKAGILEFIFEGETPLMEVHVFEANGFKGTPSESDEMCPDWYPISNLPYEKMWAGDYLWYPMVLNGACFNGTFHYRGHDTVLSHTLHEVKPTEIE